MTVGTVNYAAPEQLRGDEVDGRADQYSLGLIAYEMIAGRRPFQADNLAELMYKHRFEEPEVLVVGEPLVDLGQRDRAAARDGRLDAQHGLGWGGEGGLGEGRRQRAGGDELPPPPPPHPISATVQATTTPSPRKCTCNPLFSKHEIEGVSCLQRARTIQDASFNPSRLAGS